MRVSTSVFSVKSCLGHRWEEFKETSPYKDQLEDRDALSWTWIFTESKTVVPPRSFSSQLKAQPSKMLQHGLERGFFEIKLSVKPEKGRVWITDHLLPVNFPEEVVRFFSDRMNKKTSTKWNGEAIEIYSPMHQKHPGLTEHALLGAVEVGSSLLCFVSDSQSPDWATFWHVFELIPNKHLALNKMETIERSKQREFEGVYEGETFEMRDGLGVKLSMDELVRRLDGNRRFSWAVNSESEIEIPTQTRRFKLGESITDSERRAMPIEEVMKMLTAACR